MGCCSGCGKECVKWRELLGFEQTLEEGYLALEGACALRQGCGGGKEANRLLAEVGKHMESGHWCVRELKFVVAREFLNAAKELGEVRKDPPYSF